MGCTVKRVNTSTALTGGVNYLIAFTSEEYDTDGFHDNSTNNTRITIPAGKAGKYLLTGSINTPNNNPGNYQYFQLLKNGSDYTASGIRGAQVVRRASGGENALLAFSQSVDAAVSDYFEIQYQQQLSFTDDIWANFQAAYLGA